MSLMAIGSSQCGQRTGAQTSGEEVAVGATSLGQVAKIAFGADVDGLAGATRRGMGGVWWSVSPAFCLQGSEQ